MPVSAVPGSSSITLRLTDPNRKRTSLQGFTHFWAHYVTGFNPEKKCQACFKGYASKLIHRSLPVGDTVEMNERTSFPHLYVCGVSLGDAEARRTENFHLALQQKRGAQFTKPTAKGYLMEVTNAIELEIPNLPEGIAGLTRSQIHCKNFRFARHYFPDQRLA